MIYYTAGGAGGDAGGTGTHTPYVASHWIVEQQRSYWSQEFPRFPHSGLGSGRATAIV
ncbi:hypothetical protein PILCRDRAFT_812287 [Piloderma croceum F 1598]|uniref:Uncharacterized protein n=1 Tax=Piloderma croceum (strain F 1598) TaxID=765440 RepID=A0A0C3G2F4_PILCF|nr:hypothetical protein PILCRDRAFT_812287 [Piloderma croceum F 1598]